MLLISFKHCQFNFVIFFILDGISNQPIFGLSTNMTVKKKKNKDHKKVSDGNVDLLDDNFL